MNLENWYFLDLRLVRALVKKLGWNLLMEIQRIASVIRGTKGLMFELRLLCMTAYLLGILARVLLSFFILCSRFLLIACPPNFKYCNWARKIFFLSLAPPPQILNIATEQGRGRSMVIWFILLTNHQVLVPLMCDSGRGRLNHLFVFAILLPWFLWCLLWVVHKCPFKCFADIAHTFIG